MQEYYGMIDGVSVSNINVQEAPVKEGSQPFLEIDDKFVSFVHYPDCQQLSVRIPNNGWDYQTFKLYNATENRIVEETRMIEKLNGNYRVLYDTVTLKPAAYKMDLILKPGLQHTILFIKHDVEAIKVKAPEKIEPVFSYDVNDRNRRVIVNGHLRSATVIYIDGDVTLSLGSEMGGGSCMFYILVPTEEEWERYTGTPLSEREDILAFVARYMQLEKAGGNRFEIDYSQITFYRSGY